MAAAPSLVERYDRLAEGYRRWWAPTLAPTALRVLDRLERIDAGLPVAAPRDVLDLGSGTGTLALAAVQRWPGARVTAFDASGGMLAVARRDAESLSAAAHLRLEFLQGDAAELPFRAGAFDVAVSSFMVQLVPDRLAVLREVARVLRPGGRFSIVGWMRDGTPFAPEDAFEDALDEAEVERPDEEEARSGDFRSLRAATEELRRAGFRAVHAAEDEVARDWTPEEYAGYCGYHDAGLLDSLPAEQQAAFWAAFRRRLDAVSPEALRFRAPVVALTARRP